MAQRIIQPANGNFICTHCFKEKPSGAYYYEIREQNRLRAAARHRVLRDAVLNAYGNTCACCNENVPEFLGIDHVNNDGAKHRKEVKGKSAGLYGWLKKRGYPKDGFQLLCHNCNFAKGLYGQCPHGRTDARM